METRSKKDPNIIDNDYFTVGKSSFNNGSLFYYSVTSSITDNDSFNYEASMLFKLTSKRAAYLDGLIPDFPLGDFSHFVEVPAIAVA